MGDLRPVMDAAADRLGCVADEDGGATWSREGRLFAALSADGSVAEFRLDGPIAAAARRTPDTSESGRGREWVAFAPPTLERTEFDRIVAWFEAAWRRAG